MYATITSVVSCFLFFVSYVLDEFLVDRNADSYAIADDKCQQ